MKHMINTKYPKRLNTVSCNQYFYKSMKILVTALLFFIFLNSALLARDFYESDCVIDPLKKTIDEKIVFFPSNYGELKYTNHLFLSTPEDVYYFSVLGACTIFNIDNIAALRAYYSSYNLIGPLGDGDTAATIGQWWMNCVEFEYGITGAINFFDYHLILEYARISQHNFRPMYSEVTTDNLKIGVVFPPLVFKNFVFDYYIRGGFVDLFDFWQSTVPKPRVEWIITPNLKTTYKFNNSISAFYKIYCDINFLRDPDSKPGVDTSLYMELGIILEKDASQTQFFLEYYQTPDTEELRYESAPAKLLGLGFRASIGE